MRTLAAQPESMAGSMARALTLGPMGRQRGVDTFCLIISLILGNLHTVSELIDPYYVRKPIQERYIVRYYF